VVTFRVSLSAASATPVSVTVSTADGSAIAGLDYQALSPTRVTFPPGTAEQDLEVPVLGDAYQEGNEAFALKLSAPSGAVIGDPSAIGTLIDDDGRLHAYVSDAWTMEGNAGPGSVSFQVTLSDTLAPGQVATVSVATKAGTATAGTDYQSVAKTALTWTSSDSPVKTVTVVIFGDASLESNEIFFLALSSPSINLVVADTQGLGTIINDD
jgi:hypothetical protein